MRPFIVGLQWQSSVGEWNQSLPSAPITADFSAEFGPRGNVTSSIRYRTEAPLGRAVVLETDGNAGWLLSADDLRSQTRNLPGIEKLRISHAVYSPWQMQPQIPPLPVSIAGLDVGQSDAVRNYVLTALQPLAAGGLYSALQAFRYVSSSRHVENSIFNLGQVPSENPRTASELIDTLAYNDHVLQAVSDRCLQLFGYKIDKDLIPDRKVSLVAITGNQRHNVVHVGAGLIQTIWIITQLELARTPRPTWPQQIVTTVGIEEPELHLHPAAQPDIARMLVEFAKTLTLICTTQSEHLLESILTLILEGALNPADLAVYYVDGGKVEPMEVDDRGQIVGGLRGFFETNEEQLKRQIELMKRRD